MNKITQDAVDKVTALDIAIDLVRTTFGKNKAYHVLKGIKHDHVNRLPKEKRRY